MVIPLLTVCCSALVAGGAAQEAGEDMARIKAVEREVRAEVQEAAERAKQQPQPPTEALWTDVYQTKEGNIGFRADRRASLGF